MASIFESNLLIMDKKIIKRDVSLRFVAICQYLMYRYNIDSDAKFCKKIGIHTQVFSDIKKGKLQVGIDTISILLTKFGNINTEWLFSGNGDMIRWQTKAQKDAIDQFYTAIKNDPQIEKVKINDILSDLFPSDYPEVDYEQYEVRDKNDSSVFKQDLNAIPIIEIEAAAGIGAFNSEHLEVLGHLTLPENSLQRKDARYFAIRTRGQSMSPTIFDKDYLIVRHLERSEWQSLRDEYVYVVVDGEGKSYVKRIKDRMSRGFIVCMSDNLDKGNYPNFTLEEDEIMNLFYVELKMSPHLPNINSTYYDRMKSLEDRMDYMESHVAKLDK